MPRISITIITKNEELNIGPCLETAKWADEIVIVDSYSTDRTIEICRMYTEKVFQRAFVNYSDQRNFADEKATGNWILSLDADERISGLLKNEILQKICSDIPKFDSYLVPHLEHMFGKQIRHGGWYPQYHVRIYKKGSANWVGGVHERIVARGDSGILKNPILHYSHINISKFVQKLDRYTTIESEEANAEFPGYAVLKMLLFPPVVFLYKYFILLGFLDGIHGIVAAVSLSYYHFIRYAKRWEKGKNR